MEVDVSYRAFGKQPGGVSLLSGGRRLRGFRFDVIHLTSRENLSYIMKTGAQFRVKKNANFNVVNSSTNMSLHTFQPIDWFQHMRVWTLDSVDRTLVILIPVCLRAFPLIWAQSFPQVSHFGKLSATARFAQEFNCRSCEGQVSKTLAAHSDLWFLWFLGSWGLGRVVLQNCKEDGPMQQFQSLEGPTMQCMIALPGKPYVESCHNLEIVDHRRSLSTTV